MNKNRVFISNSTIHGRGVFANKEFKKGETVIMVRGNRHRFFPKNKTESLSYSNWIGISLNTWIDPLYPANLLNHSCQPNTGIRGKVHIVAMNNIKKGDEITIDYSTTEIDKLWSMKCNCGANNCRKNLKSIQFLPNKITKKYLPYINTDFKKYLQA